MHTEAVVLKPNEAGEVHIELHVSVEDDDGIFLSLRAFDNDMSNEVFDYISEDFSDIQDFFTAVERARVEFVRLLKEKNIDLPLPQEQG